MLAVGAEGSTVLTDPGPVCSGHTVVLTCSAVEGTIIAWRYRGEDIGLSVSLSLSSGAFFSDEVTLQVELMCK